MRVFMPGRILDREVGGNSTYARHLARELRVLGHEVTSIRPGVHPVTTMVRETVFGLGSRTAGDLVHYVADTGPLLRVRAPSVVTVHGVASRWTSVARDRRQEFVWRARVKRAIVSTDRVVTVSESSANDVSEIFGVARERIKIIPHGIDDSYFSRGEAGCQNAVSPTLADEGPFVLYVGNIEPRKNIESLVRAFDLPELRNIGARLVIAGRPAWNCEAILSTIRASPRTTYLGFVSEVQKRQLLRQCELFAFPSLYEGFGFPVVEALASGAVVISARSGSLEEVAGPSLTFPALDPAGIAQGIAAALTDSDARDGCRAAGRDWSSRFSWQESARAHVAVYEEVVGT